MPYVPPKYPGAIPTAVDLPDRTDDVDWMYAARYNELKKELRACLIELGVDPAGAHATVVARLDALGVGDVVGPGAALDEAIVRYHGTSGKIIQATLGAKIDDTGRLTNTTQPAFNVLSAAEQTNFAINSSVDIVLGTEQFDIGNNFASNIFTAPITGKYQLNASIVLDDIDTGAARYLLTLVTSNTVYAVQINCSKMTADLDNWSLVISALADMDINDTAKITVYQVGGAQQTDIESGSAHFTGILIC